MWKWGVTKHFNNLYFPFEPHDAQKPTVSRPYIDSIPDSRAVGSPARPLPACAGGQGEGKAEKEEDEEVFRKSSLFIKRAKLKRRCLTTVTWAGTKAWIFHLSVGTTSFHKRWEMTSAGNLFKLYRRVLECWVPSSCFQLKYILIHILELQDTGTAQV